MGNLYKILILSLVSLHCFGQEMNRTFDSKGKQYELSVKIEHNGSTKVKVTNTADDSEIVSTELNPFNFEQFRNQLSPALKSAAGLAPAVGDNEIEATVQNLFYDTMARSMSLDDTEGPVAGDLIIKPSIESYEYNRSNIRNLKSGTSADKESVTLDVQQVQIEVFEGFIENVSVTAKETGGSGAVRVFSNEFGIGFASKNNMGNLHSYFLVEKDKPTKGKTMINLGELICFNVRHEPGRRDYAPNDNAYVFNVNGKKVVTPLYKSPTKRLIEARVFSDFIGLNQDKPNGLIQTEISKRINTNTNRGLIFQRKNVLNDAVRFVVGQGGGLLQYVIPTLTLSKLEENNRSIVVHRERDLVSNESLIFKKPVLNEDGNQIGLKDTILLQPMITGKPYVTAIELLRNQNFSAGLDFNILYSENVGGKFNFYLDGGLKFGRTSIRDSLSKIEKYQNIYGVEESRIVKSGFVNNFGVNTFQIYPHLKMQWLPDERFGVTLSRKWTYFKMWNGEIENGDLLQGNYSFASDATQTSPSKKYTWINTWELLAFLKLTDNGKLFFRYRINYEAGHKSYNFNQAQVGYSFYILGNRSAAKGSKSSE
jgi:hypothetical protein